MAIEDYTGVTKIDDYLYEVTGEVNLDAQATLEGVNAGETFAIGDMDNCTFIMKNGGFLRFVSGDSTTEPYTTFKDCTFIETSTAKEIVGDTYYRGPHYQISPGVYDTIPNASRWYSPGEFTFEGCTFIVDTATTFDITSRGHAYNFLATPEGKRCRFFADVSVHPPNMTENMYWTAGSTITGLFFDIASRAMLNPDELGNKNNILIADKDPGNLTTGNFSSQISTYDPQYGSGHKFYRGIQARAVFLQQTPHYHWWFTASAGQTNFSGTADSSAGTGLTLSIQSGVVSQSLYPLHSSYAGEGGNTITNPDWDRIDTVTGFYIDDLVYSGGEWKFWKRLWVYKNDVLLEQGTDYTFWENAVNLTSGAAAGDVIHIKMEERNRPDLRTVNLIDPIGGTVKQQAADYHGSIGGTLKLWRTLSGEFVDISTKAAIPSVRTVITRDSTSKLELDEVAGSFSVELNYTEELMEFNNVVEDGDYTAKFLSYGYDLQTRGITIADTTDPNGYDQGAILLFQDDNVTERTEATVAAYTSVSTTPQIYDYFKHWEMTRPTAEVGIPYATINAAGDTLDFGDKDIYFGQYGTGNVINYFDNTYVTPQGKTPGQTETGGFIDGDPTVGPTFDTNVARSEFTSHAGYGGHVTRAIKMSPDGTRLWLCSSAYYDSNRVYISQYNLSTAYDISTAVFEDTYNIPRGSAQMEGTSTYWGFSSDGLHITFWHSGLGRWGHAILNTAWDMSGGISAVTGSTSGGSVDLGWRCHFWNDDGSRVYFLNYNQIREYTTSVPFQLASISYVTLRSISNNPAGSWMNAKWLDNGNKLWLSNSSQNQYRFVNCTTPYRISTMETVDWSQMDGGSYIGKGTNTTFFADLEGETITTMDENNILYAAFNTDGFDFATDSFTVPVLFNMYGAPNSIFIESGASIVDGGSDFTTMKTTGYFYEQGTTSINTQTQDATGVGTTVTIKGINPNTEVRMYRVSDDTEIAGVEDSIGTQTSLAYNFVQAEDTYIIIHNTNYVTSPSRIAFTTQAAAATLTVFQQIDRAYSNP